MHSFITKLYSASPMETTQKHSHPSE